MYYDLADVKDEVELKEKPRPNANRLGDVLHAARCKRPADDLLSHRQLKNLGVEALLSYRSALDLSPLAVASA